MGSRELNSSLDVALSRHWSRSMSLQFPSLQKEREENHHQKNLQGKQQQQQQQQHARMWPIDMSKLVICEVLGVGAIGKVHRGFYNDQEVAIKLLDCTKNQGGNGVTDWRRLSLMKELKVWRRLDHANIVKFIGASPGVADKHASSNVCCIVSEFMPRGNLRDYLFSPTRRGRPSMELVLRLATDVAKGLEYLHARSIVHRDVKTRNILLDSNLRAKLGDFDSARVEADDLNDMSGEVGTAGYMAPEVINGMPYDRKSDVFSFGVCLLEMFYPDIMTGGGGGGGMVLCLSFVDLTKKGLALSSKLRTRVPRSCPPQLAVIMKKCLKKDPNKRPSMSEVVSMLGAIRPGTAMLTRRSSIP